MSTKLRIGVIGLGHAGSRYANILLENRISGAILAAVCTRTPSELKKYPADVPKFVERDELIRSGCVDAVIIATPHHDHAPSGTAALQAGLHVLVEKPIAAHLAEARRFVGTHKNARLVFAVMFNLRAHPAYARIHKLVLSGKLGTIQRVHGTFTAWYRTQSYFSSSNWRGTWAGEGGGILVNQAPHFLDLTQWILGMPSRVTAFCRWGKHHSIEVEDEVTAFLEYPDGCTASLIFSTGEAPGQNRLEVIGDRGSLILEDDCLQSIRASVSTRKHTMNCRSPYLKPVSKRSTIRLPRSQPLYDAMIQNFVNAARKGNPLIAPAEDSLSSIEIADAMLLSAIDRQTVSLPLDIKRFERVFSRTLKKGPLGQ